MRQYKLFVPSGSYVELLLLKLIFYNFETRIAGNITWMSNLSDGFLNAVQMVGSKMIIGRPIGGIGTVIGDEQELVTEGYSFALRICNSAQRSLQKIPFSVIYKEEFPEESSHVIIGDEWNPIGDFNDNPPGFKP